MRILLVVACALLAGLGAGFFSAYGEYVAAESRMGPFSDRHETSQAELDAYLSGNRQADSGERYAGRAEVVGEAEFNFGTMQRGSEGSHVFVIKNVGDGVLGLKVTGSTCKCTVGKLKESELKPGESTEVAMEWTARTAGALFTQSATLRTTDPENAELKLKITGTLTDAVFLDPDVWSVGDIQADEVDKVTTNIFVFSDEPVYVFEADWVREWDAGDSRVEITDGELTAEERQEYPQAKSVKRVVVHLPGEIRQGPLRETFRFRMGIGESAEEIEVEEELLKEIMLVGKVVGPVSMIGGPSLTTEDDVFRLKLGDTTVGERTSKKLFVAVRKDVEGVGQLQLAGLEPEEVLEATLGEPRERGEALLYPLEVALKASAPPMQRNGTSGKDWGVITLKDSAEIMPPVKLYVTFRVLDLVDAR